METYIDDQREMKHMLYDLFKGHPDLLTPVEEGLSKGACGAPCTALVSIQNGQTYETHQRWHEKYT